MSAWRFGAIVILLTAAAPQSSDQDWSRNTGYGADFAVSQAICRSVLHTEIPAADLPTPAERRALEGCSSEVLYYGIGMPADPVKARKCAVTERGRHDQPFAFFSGEAMLMTVYANGSGAARNYDVAIHMACQVEDAAFAIDSRVKRLDAYRRAGWKGHDFGGCADNSSGIGGGVCADHFARLDGQRRDRRIARLGQRWTGPQRARFPSAYKRFVTYAGTAHEMDCFQGTAMAQCQIDGQNRDAERFLKRVEALADGRTPVREARAEGEGTSPATTGDAAWRRTLRDVDPGHRDDYERNRNQAIAERTAFERDLVAFARAVFPKRTPHEIRRLFSDL